MQDQSTQRKVDATGETPVDEPVGGQTAVKRPGAWGVETNGGEQQGQPVPEPKPLKPFVIPKMTLFQDLPYSVTKIPPLPPTPPPAYSTTVPAAARPVVEPLTAKSEQDYTFTATTHPSPEAESGFSLSPPPEPSSLEQDYVSSPVPIPLSPLPVLQPPPISSATMAAMSAPVRIPRRPKTANDRLRTPPTRPPRSPQGTSPNQITFSTEKQTTPKLNRNSGTRAIAQAQMFEAWARGQTDKEVASHKDSTSPSRPVSVTASSASEYSNPLVEEQSRERGKTSIEKSDPAVFGGFVTPPDTTKERDKTTRRSGRLSADNKIERTTSKTALIDTGVPSSRLVSDRRPPFDDHAQTFSPEQPRQFRASQTSSRDVTPLIRGNKTYSPELNRRPSAAKPLTKTTPRTVSSSRHAPFLAAPLPRSTSVSSQQSQNSTPPTQSSPTPRPLTRSTTSPAPGSTSAGRKGMTASMTSGTRNRAMSLRFDGKEAPSGTSRLQRSRTNSNLYREIGDLVRDTASRERQTSVPPLMRQSGSRDQDKDAMRDAKRNVP
jgi:hypothetical protein